MTATSEKNTSSKEAQSIVRKIVVKKITKEKSLTCKKQQANIGVLENTEGIYLLIRGE